MRSTRFFLILAVVFASVLGTALLSACATHEPTLVSSETSYDSTSAFELLRKTSTEDVSKQPADDAEKLRQAALADLRGVEDGGNEAADFMTESFPAKTGGVPVYVERARFDGKDAWLIVEAIGRPGGTLEDKRLWVLTTDGDVLYSAVD